MTRQEFEAKHKEVKDRMSAQEWEHFVSQAMALYDRLTASMVQMDEAVKGLVIK